MAESDSTAGAEVVAVTLPSTVIGSEVDMAVVDETTGNVANDTAAGVSKDNKRGAVVTTVAGVAPDCAALEPSLPMGGRPRWWVGKLPDGSGAFA